MRGAAAVKSRSAGPAKHRQASPPGEQKLPSKPQGMPDCGPHSRTARGAKSVGRKRPVTGAASTISSLPRDVARLSGLIAIAAFLRYSASLRYLGLV